MERKHSTPPKRLLRMPKGGGVSSYIDSAGMRIVALELARWHPATRTTRPYRFTYRVPGHSRALWQARHVQIIRFLSATLSASTDGPTTGGAQ